MMMNSLQKSQTVGFQGEWWKKMDNVEIPIDFSKRQK